MLEKVQAPCNSVEVIASVFFWNEIASDLKLEFFGGMDVTPILFHIVCLLGF